MSRRRSSLEMAQMGAMQSSLWLGSSETGAALSRYLRLASSLKVLVELEVWWNDVQVLDSVPSGCCSVFANWMFVAMTIKLQGSIAAAVGKIKLRPCTCLELTAHRSELYIQEQERPQVTLRHAAFGRQPFFWAVLPASLFGLGFVDIAIQKAALSASTESQLMAPAPASPSCILHPTILFVLRDDHDTGRSQTI